MRPSLKNIKKRTPVKLKMLGDFALMLIPTIQAGIGSAPEGLFTPAQSWAIGFVSSLFLVGFKFFTKMFTDEGVQDESN